MEPKGPLQLGPELLAVLEKLLQDEGLSLEHHTVTKASAVGDNYVGDVFRVVAKGKSDQQVKEYRFIFKCPISSKKYREELNTIKFMRNEAAFYTEIMPRLDAVVSKRVTIPPFPHPKFYHVVCGTENDVLVLEDLGALGFKMADKFKGLDIEHCLLVLQELGRLHATSIAMKYLHPEDFDALKQIPQETLFYEKGRKEFGDHDKAVNGALKMLKNRYPNHDYADVLSKFTSNFFDNMMELVSTESALSVINHGDCWVNNLLFKYDEAGQRPTAVRCLDFQICRYGSPALDLSYFIYNCTLQKTRDEEWEEMITTYLAELNETLAILRIPAAQISRAQLDVEMLNYAKFGVGMALLTIPLFTAMDEIRLEDGKAAFVALHGQENPLCEERLTDIVVDAIKREYLT